DPGYAIAWSNRSVALHALRRYAEAVDSCERALLAEPAHADAFYNRGNALQALRRDADAVASYDRALALRPDYAKAHTNRGNALYALKRYEEALAAYDRALALTPHAAEALSNRGNVLGSLGDLDEAIRSYRRALAVSPADPRVHHALIFALLRSAADAEDVRAQCAAFAECFEHRSTPLEHRNSAVPTRRLKVGYVSADFRAHSVAWHIAPVLENHDPQAVEVYCYFNHPDHDPMTERLMKLPVHWREVADLTDVAFASLVQQDGIDILVDLAGHTTHSRLVAFARRPAPLQVTWLGLPATTGLSSIDYRITDDSVDPVGRTEHYQSERLVRLSTHACYQPPHALLCATARSASGIPENSGRLPPVNDLPALSRGYVTFASFNELDKISPATCALWASVLREVPDSRLLVVCEPSAAKRARERFIAAGISAERLKLEDKRPLADYLKLHNEVDVALDPFPFNGGTVTRNALWMGVPVITLAGTMPVSRVGLALMTQLGLDAFVAKTPDEYVQIAARCARDPGALAEIRRSLRRLMEEAPFSNCAAYTRELEAAYRWMWETWCAQAAA
ncbi:MAG TPA: tetratricopeptide repeat protein, partial [Burkholderiales bacterium]|nr:tetratricopeptide repeat protein [Burkholderiales bacterium]